MAKLFKVIELGNPILRTKAKVVLVTEIKSKKFQNFCDNLIATCKANNGVGIASPQVGVDKRVFIIWSRSTKSYNKAPTFGPVAIINPKIISKSKQLKKSWEGCLSIPGIRALVPRHTSIEVEYTTREGKKVRETHKDFIARIFQHEYDHLEGKVFLDIVNSKDIVTEAEFKKIIKKRN